MQMSENSYQSQTQPCGRIIFFNKCIVIMEQYAHHVQRSFTLYETQLVVYF